VRWLFEENRVKEIWGEVFHMVRIITDSTSDVRPDAWAKFGVTVLPLSVSFGEKTFLDGVDLTNEAFYEMLANAARLPTTSQINPDTFSGVFKQYTSAGDDVVGIFISSKLSGTCNSALIAAQEVIPDKIFVVDSKIGTFGLSIVVHEALKLRDAGMGAAEIADKVKQLAERVRLVAMVDTLKYLRMGGRISAVASIVGGVLGIKPIVDLQDGSIHNIGKVRGRQSVMQFILKYLDDHPVDTNLTFATGHSNARHWCDHLCGFLKPHLPIEKILFGEIGSVIGSHVGPGAFGFAYFEKE